MRLDKPSDRSLQTLKMLLSPASGNNIDLSGLDALVWEQPDKLDLVVFQPKKSESLFASLLSDTLIYWLHQAILYPIVSSAFVANWFVIYFALAWCLTMKTGRNVNFLAHRIQISQKQTPIRPVSTPLVQPPIRHTTPTRCYRISFVS